MSESDFRPTSIAVIGAYGKMGAMFCSRFAQAGFDVRKIDQPLSERKLQKGLAGADIVLLSVPAAVFTTVLQQLRNILEPTQILTDVTSVKVEPMRIMKKYHTGPIVGTHPLFGPSPKEDEVRVAITPTADAPEQAIASVENIFSRIDCKPFRTTAEEHDKAAAKIQGLNFVTTVSYLATLAHDDSITPYLTPSFQRRLNAAQKMLVEDAELFEGLFEANPYSQDSARAFRAMLNVAAGGDISVLVDRALWWWRNKNSPGGVCQ